MLIAIIDADLIGIGNHRFPNLAAMKISAFYKSHGEQVVLKTDYENLEAYDKVYISKVFIDTEIPLENENEDKTLKKEDTVGEYYADHQLLCLSNVEYGGTGFFYDKAPPLPAEMEHIMPDYHLYDDVVKSLLDQGVSRKSLEYYLDYSIGFTTRGCIRGCDFCVNKNYKNCTKHSSIQEFIAQDRPYICLLDDNILACPQWKEIFHELQATGKPFQFKQGCDERLLTDEKCIELFKKSKWIGDYIFAFDNIRDKDLIESKLKLIRKYSTRILKFYVFVGYNHSKEPYDDDFWKQDIIDAFKRIQILASYGCVPYIMRHNNYKKSPYRGMYVNLARWCNQVQFFKKKSYREFVMAHDGITKKEHSTIRYTKEFLKACPEIEQYFDIKFEAPSIYREDEKISAKPLAKEDDLRYNN